MRNLEMRDLPHMYEWMHDEKVTANLQAPFSTFTEEKITQFIENAIKQDKDSENLHYAITDENDEYMGTISLKNINRKDLNAEYAIATRSKAHGRGYAKQATFELMKKAFEELGLEKVYLYVSVENVAADKFYKKCGFVEEGVFRKHLRLNDRLTDIRWYSMLKQDFTDKE